MKVRRALAASCSALTLFSLSAIGGAQTDPETGHAEESTDEAAKDEGAKSPDAALDEATLRAQNAYRKGLELAKREQWGDALAAFEEAAAARDAPLTRYNIAYCQRALGRYVAARRTAQRLIEAPEGLPSSYLDDLRSFVAEFNQIIVVVDVTIEPSGAVLTVDGRPPVRNDERGAPSPGAPEPPPPDPDAGPPGRLTLALDPGSHLFRAHRKGHQDVLVQRSFAPGQKARLHFALDEMPATIVVKASERDAIVRVDDREVGLAPIEFQRPAGSYRLEVEKDSFEPYRAQLDLEPGQRTELTAEMQPYEQPLHEKWWFWTAIGGTITAGVVIAVVLTRPEPEPPPYQTGNSDRLVELGGFRF